MAKWIDEVIGIIGAIRITGAIRATRAHGVDGACGAPRAIPDTF